MPQVVFGNISTITYDDRHETTQDGFWTAPPMSETHYFSILWLSYYNNKLHSCNSKWHTFYYLNCTTLQPLTPFLLTSWWTLPQHKTFVAIIDSDVKWRMDATDGMIHGIFRPGRLCKSFFSKRKWGILSNFLHCNVLMYHQASYWHNYATTTWREWSWGRHESGIQQIIISNLVTW